MYLTLCNCQKISFDYNINYLIKGVKNSYYPSEVLTYDKGVSLFFNILYAVNKSEFSINYNHVKCDRVFNKYIHFYSIYDKLNLRGSDEDTIYGAYVSNFYLNNFVLLLHYY